MTIAERLRQEGMEKGRLMEHQGVLLKLLKKKFGEMTPDLEQKLRQSGLDLLDRFGDSIFDFNSLKEAEKWWDDYGKGGTA